jgi:hypothetical protein
LIFWFFGFFFDLSYGTKNIYSSPDRADILAKSPPTPKGVAVEREY